MFHDKNNESKLQIDTKLYKMAMLFELIPIAECASRWGFATESIAVTISCQVSHKFPPETERSMH